MTRGRTRLRRRPKRRNSVMASSAITDQDIRDAAAALEGIAVRTPLLWVPALQAYLKREDLQPVGAFKVRGAYNAVRRLPEAARRRGVITYSSGNHGQALAF